jgi:hypothetical protein
MNPGGKEVLIAMSSGQVMDEYQANRHEALLLFEPVPHGTDYLNVALFITTPVDCHSRSYLSLLDNLLW